MTSKISKKLSKEARYNQGIDYFNGVTYIEDYTKKGD